MADPDPATKICAHCKKELPIENFVLHFKPRRRRDSYCRACKALHDRDRRLGIHWKPPLFQGGLLRCPRCQRYLPAESFYRSRSRSTTGLQCWCKDCIKQKYPDRSERHQIALKRSQERYPERHRARLLARREVRSGRLVRQPCEQCGNPKGEMHHPDYNQPLSVQWLCRQCHWALHPLTKRDE